MLYLRPRAHTARQGQVRRCAARSDRARAVHPGAEGIFKANIKNVTIEEIQKRVSEYFNIRQSDMLSTRRSRVVARPRQIAMYLSKICTTKSLPEIGKLFGGRDHTTVIHAVKKVESLYKTDISFSEHIKVLKKSFF